MTHGVAHIVAEHGPFAADFTFSHNSLPSSEYLREKIATHVLRSRFVIIAQRPRIGKKFSGVSWLHKIRD